MPLELGSTSGYPSDKKLACAARAPSSCRIDHIVFISSAFVIFLSTAMGKHQEQTIKHHQTVSNDALQLSGQLCGQAKIAELGMAALCFGEKNVRPKSRGIKEHQDQGPLGGHISSG